MSDTPISFSRARKARLRKEARLQANANAAKFGHTKAERVLAAAQADKARRILDQHRRSEED